MVDALAMTLIIGTLVLAGAWLLLAALNRRAVLFLLGTAALGELGLLVQVGWAIVRLVGGARPVGGMAVFIGYLAGSLVILPIAALWGLEERSRWGSAVVGAGFLVCTVLIVRMQQVWHG